MSANPTPAIARLRPMNIGSHFRAYSVRGDGAAAEPIDPILGVDHAWMSASTFPAHPHAGFSAVSYLFLDSETGIDNRDSIGNHTLIRPGGLHWTAAGRGVVHEEVPSETGKTVHSLQIFVNLPRERQGEAPFALSIAPEDVPVVNFEGIRIRVPFGAYGKTRSPLVLPTDVSLMDISLDEGAAVSVPIPAGQAAFVLPIHGAVTVDGRRFELDGFNSPAYPASTLPYELRLAAPEGSAKAVVFTGAPLRQPVHWSGPMAMASPEALTAAIAAFQRGEFGTLRRS